MLLVLPEFLEVTTIDIVRKSSLNHLSELRQECRIVHYGVEVNLISYVISFFITIVFSIVVLLIMRKSLNNIEMVESLKSVE